jgi:ABC-2 type transport system ATP-binding protein
MMKSPGDEAIRIEGLVRRFRGVTAVDGLSLDVPTGSVFGLLGENGAGKTTTLQVLLGLLAADAGRVDVLGLDPSRDGLEVRRRVGYVPEVPALYDWMTPAEIGWFAAGFHPDCPGGPAGYRSRFDELVRGFELPPGRRVRAVSKGMRAKVSLALALAGDPALMILDEPTSGLDVMVRREFLDRMIDLAGSGRTVLLSSHQLAEVERVASHVALIHKGRLMLAEPLDHLRARTFLVSLTFSGESPPKAPPGHLPIELVDAELAPRQARWLVHAPDRSTCEALREVPGVESLQVEVPNLEEIYIGYMKGRRPARVGPAPEAVLA